MPEIASAFQPPGCSRYALEPVSFKDMCYRREVNIKKEPNKLLGYIAMVSTINYCNLFGSASGVWL
nr:MAG TPA: hypothetical protein [Caudoviricetes sp.]